MAHLLHPETGKEYGPEFVDADEQAAFETWHKTGEQRSMLEVYEDGDLEAQVVWWRNGGYLLIDLET